MNCVMILNLSSCAGTWYHTFTTVTSLLKLVVLCSTHRHARSSDQRRLGGTQRKSRQPLPVDLLTPRPGEKVVHVLYYMDNEKIPFTRKITDRDITLGEFKEHIFARKGNYR